MDDLVTRIVEIERQCSADIEQARLAYGKRIEDHKRVLEERKINEHARISSIENSRLTEAVQEAKKQIEVTSAALRRDNESRLQDPVLKAMVQEDIISILFTG